MDALNFLFQQPTLNWLDFYLAPAKLISHLEQKKPEPSADQLIAQFCEQAKFEDQQATIPDLTPDDEEYHRKKSKKLWCLALKICTYFRWNLKTLRKKCHIVHMKCLMQELARFIIGTNDLVSVLRGDEEDPMFSPADTPTALKLTVRILCARWILDSIRIDAFPKPPPKITVSNPSAQIDPSLPLLEAKNAAVQELKAMTEVAVDVLKKVGEDGEYSLLTSDCLVIPDECGGESQEIAEFDWTKAETLPEKLVYLQCLFDLGEHYFFMRQYGPARSYLKTVWTGFYEAGSNMEDYFTLDRESLLGYCRALQIEVKAHETPVDANKPGQQSLVTKYMEEENTLNPRSLARYAQLRSKNFLASINDLFAVVEQDVQFLRRPENASTFCLTLKDQLPSDISRRSRAIIESYLRFLCSCHPPLLDTLKGCGVFERLQLTEASLRSYTSPAAKQNDSVPDLSLLSKLEPPWRVLHTFDSSELKTFAQRAEPNRVSSHFFVPVTVQPLLLKLPTSIYQDLVSLATVKAQQLTNIGAMTAVPALLELANHEARSGSGETAPELAWELMRLDLVRWHNLLHRCADVQKMGQMTMDLATKVKSFIAACGHKGVATNAHWELFMLVTSFLLNTCDWEYIILHCPSFHRFANFGKVLASLCYEVSKGSVNVRNVAREFFDIMLPTMMDTIQYKRGPGGSQGPMVREAPVQLLSRMYFTVIVKNLKEPCAVSLLVSFFVKLYNGLKNGIVEIFAEHVSMWPTTFVDATGVNEAYLKEMFLITLENALLVNPNNAFWLRARGDFELVNDRLESALQYYLQCLMSCSDGFTKPLPENVVDDKLILNMVKCCGRMECHTLEALLCQLLREPNYGLAIKALQEISNYDGIDAYYGMIWDPALLELLIYALEKSNQQQARMEMAMRVYSQQDNNIHNDENIVATVAAKRRKAFLTAMCRLFL